MSSGNTGTGAGWDETHPASGDLVSAGSTEIIDDRIGVRLRLQKEHVAPSTGTLTGSILLGTGGGEHIAGSAISYFGTSAPTTRPDTTVALGTGDIGRVWVKMSGSAVNDVQVWNGTAWISIFAGRGIVNNNCVLVDEKTAGTDGGTFTSGSWQVRTLNIKVNDAATICSLSSNQFTIGPGTFRIRASAPGYVVDQHQIRLNNTTDTLLYYGTTEFSTSAAGTATDQTRSQLSVEVVLANPKVFQLEHRCVTTKATQGFGVGASSALGVSHFAIVDITQVA